MNNAIRILLADDHPMIREGMRAILEAEAGIVVAGQAGDGREAVRLAAELAPDVVVMDLRMPEVNGLEATRRIVDGASGAKVIMVSGFAEDWAVTEAMQAGASGYVVKDAVLDELAAAIRAVAGGGVYLSPRTSSRIAAPQIDLRPRPRPGPAAG